MRHFRDGLVIAGFVVSIVAFLFAVLVVWIHVYTNRGKVILFSVAIDWDDPAWEGRRKGGVEVKKLLLCTVNGLVH